MIFFSRERKKRDLARKKKEEEERLQENRHYGRNRRVRGMAAVNRMGRNEGMYACGRQVGGDGQERAKIRTLDQIAAMCVIVAVGGRGWVEKNSNFRINPAQ